MVEWKPEEQGINQHSVFLSVLSAPRVRLWIPPWVQLGYADDHGGWRKAEPPDTATELAWEDLRLLEPGSAPVVECDVYGCLPAFLKINDRQPSAVERFARRWGILGLCVHGWPFDDEDC